MLIWPKRGPYTRPSPFAASVLASFALKLSFSSIPYGETYRSKLSTQSYSVYTCVSAHSWLRNINSEIIMIFQGFVLWGRDYYSPFGETDIYIYIYFLCVFSLSLSLFFFLAENNRTNCWKLFKGPVQTPRASRLGIRYFVNITVCKMEIKCSCLLLGNLRNIFFSYMCIYICSGLIDETLWRYFIRLMTTSLFFFTNYDEHTKICINKNQVS